MQRYLNCFLDTESIFPACICDEAFIMLISCHYVVLLIKVICIHWVRIDRETTLTGFMLVKCDCNIVAMRKALVWVITYYVFTLSAMPSSLSLSSTFVLVSSAEVFSWTSLFRWASEQGLCLSQSPWIPLWTLSGFGLCAALPVSIKMSVGDGFWHCTRTWWGTAEPNSSVTNCRA